MLASAPLLLSLWLAADAGAVLAEPGPPAPSPASSLAASSAATVATAPGATSPRSDPSLVELTGAVASVDRERRRVTVTTPGGPAELRYDRNTLVYQPGGATTVLAILPGLVLRAALDEGGVAYWVQLRPPTP